MAMRFLFSFILINVLLLSTAESQSHSWQNYGALGFDKLVNDKADPGNIVWMYHSGIIRYNVATDSAIFFDPTNSKMPLYSIRAMAPAEGGGVWVAYYTERPYSGMGAGNKHNTPGGISKITLDTIINFSLEDLSLPNYYILSMFEDSQNRLWINAENGVAGYFDGVGWNPLPPGIGWPKAKHFQYPAAEDDSGNIWIMKPDKGFIVLKNYTTWDTVSPHNSSLTDTRFSHVFNQNGHGLWAKSDSSLWLYKDSTWFKYPMPSDVVRPFRGLDSLIYLSRQYSGLYRFDGDTFVTIPPVPREYWFTMNAVETNYGIISARDTVFIWNGQNKWTRSHLKNTF